MVKVYLIKRLFKVRSTEQKILAHCLIVAIEEIPKRLGISL
ncbi:MAG: hypothetical protein ACQJCO_00940 [cyanobacterium endosymbiont of Rhopalodia sterrenbergii]